jgi:hypothetical protein
VEEHRLVKVGGVTWDVIGMIPADVALAKTLNDRMEVVKSGVGMGVLSYESHVVPIDL